MNSLKPIVWLAALLGLVFAILGVVYATHTAADLPHFLPGYDTSLSTVHVKHAIAAFVLAIGSFILAWFQSAPTKGNTEK